MCMFCWEISRGLSAKEITQAYEKMEIDDDHHEEILDHIVQYSNPGIVLEELQKMYDKRRNNPGE